MSKHPYTPQERQAAKKHDQGIYVAWLLLAIVLMIPPLTPIGIFVLIMLPLAKANERHWR